MLTHTKHNHQYIMQSMMLAHQFNKLFRIGKKEINKINKKSKKKKNRKMRSYLAVKINSITKITSKFSTSR